MSRTKWSVRHSQEFLCSPLHRESERDGLERVGAAFHSGLAGASGGVGGEKHNAVQQQRHLRVCKGREVMMSEMDRTRCASQSLKSATFVWKNLQIFNAWGLFTAMLTAGNANTGAAVQSSCPPLTTSASLMQLEEKNSHYMWNKSLANPIGYLSTRTTTGATEKATLGTGLHSDDMDWSPSWSKPAQRGHKLTNGRRTICNVRRTRPSGWPVSLPSRPADERPAGWGPGPAGAAPRRGCWACGQSGSPEGVVWGKAKGWGVSANIHKNRCRK